MKKGDKVLNFVLALLTIGVMVTVYHFTNAWLAGAAVLLIIGFMAGSERKR